MREESFDTMFELIERAKAAGIARRDNLISEIARDNSEHLAKVEALVAELQATHEKDQALKTAALSDIIAKLEKLGVAPPPPPKTAASGKRASRGQVQDEILSLFSEPSIKLKRVEILERLKAEGNNSRTTSISNALSSLKKSTKLLNIGGSYCLPQE